MNVVRHSLDAGGLCRIVLLLLFLGGRAWAESAEIVFDHSIVVVESAAGAVDFDVELAVTPAQRQRGLMYRDHLEPNRGMLFDFGRSIPVSMWMRNTYIPLDMLFIRESGEIAKITRDTVPLSETIIASDSPVRAVLELPGGTSDRLGLQPGDRVIHPLFVQ